ncbi:hypothetical protein CDAR_192591 [Caerostris darwini]|uniref:Uncharacterized protein n=1 Tax=Caerostris darwini TaxID=1538125 RepID=A0AAV4W7V8_9ARAC|nr:hypothetical protein CDAR_192591 [Caerostris darwini]
MESRKNYKLPEVHGVEKEVKKPIDVEVYGNSEKTDNVSSLKNENRNRGETEQRKRSSSPSSSSDLSPEYSPTLDETLKSDLDDSIVESLNRAEECEKIFVEKDEKSISGKSC